MKPSSKLFIGYRITPEIRMHLSQSAQWKHAVISPNKQGQELQEVHFGGQDYIGSYLTQEMVSLNELQITEAFVKQRFSSYCSNYTIENARVCVFAQVFIA